MIVSLTFRGVATIKCLSTYSLSSRKTKLWQPANVSTPKSATVRGINTAPPNASASVKSAVEDFTIDNDIAACFLGICQDFKCFGFAVSVLILNEGGTKIVRLLRGSL